jgi:hypothetical protein
MDFNAACRALELQAPFTEKELRAAYYRCALEFHPDRNDSAEAADKFREAADANDLLRSYLDITADGASGDPRSGAYDAFMRSLFGDPVRSAVVSSLCDHLRGRTKDLALQALDGLDRKTALEVVGYLSAYKDVLRVDDDTVEQLRTRVVGACTARVVLNPTIDNLLNKDVYCLEAGGRILYVPLWHEEVVYDVSGGSVIVANSLELPEGVAIDHNNDIHVRVRYPLGQAVSEEVIPVSVGGKVFELQRDQLRLRSAQTARIKSVGAPRINTANLLDASSLGDIVVHLEMY